MKPFAIILATALLALTLSQPSLAVTYNYDNLNRLTQVAYDNGGKQTYSYDAAGNMLDMVSTPPAVTDHALSVQLQGAGSGKVTGPGIDCGSSCSSSFANNAAVTLTAVASSGSSFDGWGGACTGKVSTCNVSMTAATNVIATFVTGTPTTYALNITLQGSGSVSSAPAGINCGATCSANFSGSVTLTALAQAGNSFTGWSGACTGLSTCVLDMTAPRSVTASFAPSNGGNLTMPFVLAQGWNLLGNSLTQPLAVNPTLSNPAVVNTVWKWDVAAGGWQFYTPAMDAAALQAYATSKNYGVLSVINPGEGYWVNAKAPTTLASQTGTGHTLVATNLAQGWNLVATGNAVPPTPSAFNSALSATPPSPGSVPLNLTTLWAWDTAASNWYFYAPSLEASGGLAAYIASKGYLDFTAASKTLGNGVGFWVNKP